MAAWYRGAMPKEGWRLAKEEEALQVWVRQKYSNDPIVHLRFNAGYFTMEFMSTNWGLNGVPLHPKGQIGICGEPGVWCQLILGDSGPAAKAWFHEYLGYLGWEQRPSGEYFRGTQVLRLEVRETDKGAEVAFDRTSFQDPRWPPPPSPTPR